jgi:prophage regulatory protein
VLKKFVTYEQLKDYGIDFSRQHIDRLERAGKFPKRVPMGANRIAWVEEEIIAWVKQRLEARAQGIGVIGSHKKMSRRGMGAPKPRASCG